MIPLFIQSQEKQSIVDLTLMMSALATLQRILAAGDRLPKNVLISHETLS